MTAITSPLSQIEQFNQAILRISPEHAAIESAKHYFQDLLRYSDDPACQRALNAARVLLDLREEQAILVSKVQSILIGWEKLEHSVPKITETTYAEIKEEIQNLKTAILDLREDAFPTEVPKQAIVSRLELFDQFIENKNPNAWKLRAMINASIAGGFGVFFAYAPRVLESAFICLDDIARTRFNSFLCERAPNLSCADSTSTSMQLGVGLLAGPVVVLGAMTFNKAMQSAIPLLFKAYAWTQTASSAEDSSNASVKENRPKTADAAPTPFISSRIPLQPLHPSKQFAYDKLTQGTPPAEPLLFSIHQLTTPSEGLNCKVFQRPAMPLTEEKGTFAFPPSTDKVQHWTADFADPHFLGYVEGPLLAQEEMLTLEHPALYHLKSLLNRTPSIQPLADNRVALIEHVGRYGALNGLYGHEFATASKELLDAKLERFETPIFSNLFAMAAPNNPGKAGMPYQKLHLKELFLRACAAFSAIASRSEGAKTSAVVHTGNWGAGAFGGSPLATALCQILAARAAGVELRYYPLDETEAFAKAQKILTNIERQQPNASAGEILLHLAKNAERYAIVYGQSNGT